MIFGGDRERSLVSGKIYAFIAQNKWSEPMKGYNIKDGQYFLRVIGK